MTSSQVLLGVGLILALAAGPRILAGRPKIPTIIILLPVGFAAGAITTDVNPQPARAVSNSSRRPRLSISKHRPDAGPGTVVAHDRPAEPAWGTALAGRAGTYRLGGSAVRPS